MIIVTGAAGFVGRYTVAQLVENGADVLATVHGAHGKAYYESKGIPVMSLDITRASDFDRLPTEDVDAVFHPAGVLSIDSPKWDAEKYFDTNITGTYNLLEYVRKNDIGKVVYCMTHSDTNRAYDCHVIGEDTPMKFGGPIAYIVSKIAALKLVDGYAHDHGIQGISLRLPGVRGYGSRDLFYNCVFHQFIRKAMRGEPIEIWGARKTYRDLVYVKDVVNAVILALNHPTATGHFNIGSGVGINILEEAAQIISVFSDPDEYSPIIFRDDIEEVRKHSWVFDIMKARIELGYTPEYSYTDGLRDFKKEMVSDRWWGLVDDLY